MFKKVFVLGLVAGACAAAAGPAPGLMRLRGGKSGYAKLTEAPGTLDKASTDNKVTVESSSGGDVNVKASFVATAANAIKTALKATSSMHGVDLEVDLDDNGHVGVDASMSGVVDGLKLGLTTDCASGKGLTDLSGPKVSAEYSHGGINAAASKSGDNVDLSATYKVNDDCSAGVSTSYDVSGGSLGDVNLAASYSMGATAVTAVVHGLKADNIGLTASHKVSDDLNVAGTFSTSDSKFSLGATSKLDGDSTVSAVVDSDGGVNVGYQRQVSSGTKLNAGVSVDAHDSGSRKAGVSMTCTI
jgi:hypothetical protein